MPDSAPFPSAKLMPKVEELRVTTGSFPASRKVHGRGSLHPEISVAMREIDLDPSAGEPPVRAYDTSGPYSDPTIEIDINRGLPELRTPWILARGDVEFYDGREVKPEDNGLRRGEASAVSLFDRGRRQVLRAKGGAAVTQLAQTWATARSPRGARPSCAATTAAQCSSARRRTAPLAEPSFATCSTKRAAATSLTPCC